MVRWSTSTAPMPKLAVGLVFRGSPLVQLALEVLQANHVALLRHQVPRRGHGSETSLPGRELRGDIRWDQSGDVHGAGFRFVGFVPRVVRSRPCSSFRVLVQGDPLEHPQVTAGCTSKPPPGP